jgi:hypothetical protein
MRAHQKFHGDECLTVLLSDVVDRADIGVIQQGRRLCLASEPGDRLRSQARQGEY